MVKLDKLQLVFESANRSEKERERLLKQKKSGSFRYNFARLVPILVRDLFGPAGTRNVHEVGARSKLEVCSSFVPDAHSKEIAILEAPVPNDQGADSTST